MQSLCRSCVHVREVVSGKGSKFYLCQRSQQDLRFPKYPHQPVLRCDGHEAQANLATTYAIDVLPGLLAVCRLDPAAEVPGWASGNFLSVTRTPNELSIVCWQDAVPEQIRNERGWRCLQVSGPLDFSIVGVIASLAGTLAAAEVSIFVVSTFDTDYLLIKHVDLETAAVALRAAGHAVGEF